MSARADPTPTPPAPSVPLLPEPAPDERGTDTLASPYGWH